MTEDEASHLVDSTIRSNVASDRMLPAGRLVSSGYDRLLTDTQTYTATAIPVPKLSAYGFKVGHRGSLFVVQ